LFQRHLFPMRVQYGLWAMSETLQPRNHRASAVIISVSNQTQLRVPTLTLIAEYAPEGPSALSAVL
jgi:hypothetical protein